MLVMMMMVVAMALAINNHDNDNVANNDFQAKQKFRNMFKKPAPFF